MTEFWIENHLQYSVVCIETGDWDIIKYYYGIMTFPLSFTEMYYTFLVLNTLYVTKFKNNSGWR